MQYVSFLTRIKLDWMFGSLLSYTDLILDDVEFKNFAVSDACTSVHA